jgi:hypothetical protein
MLIWRECQKSSTYAVSRPPARVCARAAYQFWLSRSYASPTTTQARLHKVQAGRRRDGDKFFRYSLPV